MLKQKGILDFADEILDAHCIDATGTVIILLTRHATHLYLASSVHCFNLESQSLDLYSSIEFKQSHSKMESCSVSHDGSFLLTGDDFWYVTLWPIPFKGQTQVATEWKNDFNGLIPNCIVTLLPGSTHFIKSDSRLEYWSVKPLKYLDSFCRSTIYKIKFNHDHKWMTAINDAHNLFVWRIPNLEPLFKINLNKYNLEILQIVLLHFCEENQAVLFRIKDRIYTCINKDLPIKCIHAWPKAEKYIVLFEWRNNTMLWLEGNVLHRKALFGEQNHQSLTLKIDSNDFLDMLYLDEKAQRLAIITKNALCILDCSTNHLTNHELKIEDRYFKTKISTDFKTLFIICGKRVHIYSLEEDLIKAH